MGATSSSQEHSALELNLLTMSDEKESGRKKLLTLAKGKAVGT